MLVAVVHTAVHRMLLTPRSIEHTLVLMQTVLSMMRKRVRRMGVRATAARKTSGRKAKKREGEKNGDRGKRRNKRTSGSCWSGMQRRGREIERRRSTKIP
jgi:ribulose-5-phosphate 4-epimerase/fuculose-1-phosphate aldolase